jgi:hypothetical protein
MSTGSQTIEEYINHRMSPTGRTVAELYGTENFCHFLYSLIRMDRPAVVVELGCGAATTSLMAARALRENGFGRLWTIDSGADWSSELLRRPCQSALGPPESEESYAAFIERLFATFELSETAHLVEMNLDGSTFFDPGSRIDMLFSDATPSNVQGCLSLLRYYLPRMSFFSSIFIDRAGTINHAFLFLKYLVDQLNTGKMPRHLIEGLDSERQQALETLVRTCDFQLINLTETKHGKANKGQNSRVWIKMQPVDYLPHNDVLSFGSITAPWELE